MITDTRDIPDTMYNDMMIDVNATREIVDTRYNDMMIGVKQY